MRGRFSCQVLSSTFRTKGFVAHLENTKMQRNHKREASVADFWGGIAWLRREV